MKRNLPTEAAFLSKAAGAHAHFAADVAVRLADGQDAFGDSWTERSVVELLAEVSEETLDTAAWSVLAVQKLESDDLADATRIRACLDQAAYFAARAHAAIAVALSIGKQ